MEQFIVPQRKGEIEAALLICWHDFLRFWSLRFSVPSKVKTVTNLRISAHQSWTWWCYLIHAAVPRPFREGSTNFEGKIHLMLHEIAKSLCSSDICCKWCSTFAWIKHQNHVILDHQKDWFSAVQCFESTLKRTENEMLWVEQQSSKEWTFYAFLCFIVCPQKLEPCFKVSKQNVFLTLFFFPQLCFKFHFCNSYKDCILGSPDLNVPCTTTENLNQYRKRCGYFILRATVKSASNGAHQR